MPSSAQPIESAAQLTARFAAASKPTSERRVGVEHEKLLVHQSGPRALLAPEYPLIARILDDLAGTAAPRAAPIVEHDQIIGLQLPIGGTVTLEPGGQLEHSSAPRHSLGEALADNDRHLDQLLAAAERHDLLPLALGFRPFGTRQDVPWMPKGRYVVMRNYLPTRGAHGLDMMTRTTTVQANFDWTSEADAMSMLRTAFGIGPLVTALFAASPLADGKPTGQQSTRAAAWLDTDPDRCGLLPFVFADGAGFADYVDWALSVPMFFLKRHDEYLPLHVPFGRFWAEGWQGHTATLADWELHLSTLFPNVRLRSYVEVRQADASTRAMARALPALWLGLLYDEDVRHQAWQLVASLSLDERRQLDVDAAVHGLHGSVRGQPILTLARELVALARTGLKSVAPEHVEELAPVDEIVRSGRSQADEILALYQQHGPTLALADALRLR